MSNRYLAKTLIIVCILDAAVAVLSTTRTGWIIGCVLALTSILAIARKHESILPITILIEFITPFALNSYFGDCDTVLYLIALATQVVIAVPLNKYLMQTGTKTTKHD